jgi:hypothetical protein
MGSVQLNPGEPGALGHHRGIDEALDHLFDLCFAQCARLAEGTTGQFDWNRRRSYRFGIEVADGLAAGMTELHPELIAAHRPGSGQGGQRFLATIAVDGDVAGPFQIAAVDLYIAGNHQACAAFRPFAVKPLMGLGRAVIAVRQTLGERGLGEPIGQCDATGQRHRRSNGDRHENSLSNCSWIRGRRPV